MSEMREAGLTSKSWPFEEARRVLKRYQNAPPAKVMSYSKQVMGHLAYLILEPLVR